MSSLILFLSLVAALLFVALVFCMLKVGELTERNAELVNECELYSKQLWERGGRLRETAKLVDKFVDDYRKLYEDDDGDASNCF